MLNPHDSSGYRADLHLVDSALRVANVKRVDQLAMLALKFTAFDATRCAPEGYLLRLFLCDPGLAGKFCLLLRRFFFFTMFSCFFPCCFRFLIFPSEHRWF